MRDPRIEASIAQLAETFRAAPPFDDWRRVLVTVFLEIRKRYGEREARRLFSFWGNPPTPARLRKIANLGLLDRYDMMREPNVQQLARELAEQNKQLPRSEQRGAGTPNPIALEKQIRRLLDERKRRMAADKWIGPFPPGHFDITNV
jgi:hypothetical protein